MTSLFTLSSADVFRSGKQILFDISLSINLGEHTSIIGPNGCGKSTLLSVLTREILPMYKNPPSFTVLGGSHKNLFEYRKTVGIVSEKIEKEFFTPEISGENAVLSGFFGSIGTFRSQSPTAEQYQKVHEILEELEISHLSTKKMAEMSAGERQRILLARALIHKPKALLLDEPTNALDFVATKSFLQTLQRLAQQGTTLILITHHFSEIFPEISKVVLMKEGRIAYQGNKEKVLTEKNIKEVFGDISDKKVTV